MGDNNIFTKLSTDKYEVLRNALPEITILIAGADGEIDEQELNWAEKLAYIRSYAKPSQLNDFYGEVETDLPQRIESLLAILPNETEARQQELSKRLGELNDIFLLLDNAIAFQLYSGFISFAKHIARASGGFLRFGAINKDEKEWISLPMIDPIIEDPIDEEE